jgi:hypothetical protein
MTRKTIVNTIGLLLFVLVPAFIALAALWMGGTAVRDLLRALRLTSGGQQAQGRVISSQVHHSGSGRSRTSRVIETVEFTTDRGQVIRANPVVGDAGTVDRSGMSVAVMYDRDRPERFIAPANGRSISPLGPLGKIAVCLVMLVILANFVGLGRMMGVFFS